MYDKSPLYTGDVTCMDIKKDEKHLILFTSTIKNNVPNIYSIQ